MHKHSSLILSILVLLWASYSTSEELPYKPDRIKELRRASVTLEDPVNIAYCKLELMISDLVSDFKGKTYEQLIPVLEKFSKNVELLDTKNMPAAFKAELLEIGSTAKSYSTNIDSSTRYRGIGTSLARIWGELPEDKKALNDATDEFVESMSDSLAKIMVSIQEYHANQLMWRWSSEKKHWNLVFPEIN